MWYRFYVEGMADNDTEDYVYFEDEDLLEDYHIKLRWSEWTAQLGYGMGLGYDPASALFERVTALPKDVPPAQAPSLQQRHRRRPAHDRRTAGDAGGPERRRPDDVMTLWTTITASSLARASPTRSALCAA